MAAQRRHWRSPSSSNNDGSDMAPPQRCVVAPEERPYGEGVTARRGEGGLRKRCESAGAFFDGPWQNWPVATALRQRNDGECPISGEIALIVLNVTNVVKCRSALSVTILSRMR